MLPEHLLWPALPSCLSLSCIILQPPHTRSRNLPSQLYLYVCVCVLQYASYGGCYRRSGSICGCNLPACVCVHGTYYWTAFSCWLAADWASCSVRWKKFPPIRSRSKRSSVCAGFQLLLGFKSGAVMSSQLTAGLRRFTLPRSLSGIPPAPRQQTNTLRNRSLNLKVQIWKVRRRFGFWLMCQEPIRSPPVKQQPISSPIDQYLSIKNIISFSLDQSEWSWNSAKSTNWSVSWWLVDQLWCWMRQKANWMIDQVINEVISRWVSKGAALVNTVFKTVKLNLLFCGSVSFTFLF